MKQDIKKELRAFPGLQDITKVLGWNIPKSKHESRKQLKAKKGIKR